MNRYDSTSIYKRYDGKRVYRTTQYPEIIPQDDDIIVITNDGDYLDILAQKYYGDSSLYFIICLANPGLGKGKLSVEGGLQIRLPSSNNINKILYEFNRLNEG